MKIDRRHDNKGRPKKPKDEKASVIFLYFSIKEIKEKGGSNILKEAKRNIRTKLKEQFYKL